jgi:hypothetical protein
MEIEDYNVIHIGDGKFQVEIDGEIKEAGSNLIGMIKYTYFDDGSFPEIGWSITRKQLYEDYIPKIHNDKNIKQYIKQI